MKTLFILFLCNYYILFLLLLPFYLSFESVRMRMFVGNMKENVYKSVGFAHLSTFLIRLIASIR